jgi:hypothetical protein
VHAELYEGGGHDKGMQWATHTWRWESEQYYVGAHETDAGIVEAVQQLSTCREASANGQARRWQCTATVGTTGARRKTAIDKILDRQKKQKKGQKENRGGGKRRRDVEVYKIATLNIAGYDTHRDSDRKGVQMYIGTHEDIERYLRKSKEDGEEVLSMGLQEHWLHDGEDMQDVTGYGAHLRYRTVPHIGAGRYHGGGGVVERTGHRLEMRSMA